jgi:hypothetical protein
MEEQIDLQSNDVLFDSSVLDSLNKLTDEINEDLLTDGDSDDGSDSYDSDEYTDDDEDPDSGENQLFSMMDDLVMELQMELEDDEDEEDYEVTKRALQSDRDEAKSAAASSTNDDESGARPMKNDENASADVGIAKSEPPSLKMKPPVDSTNLNQTMSTTERVEKQLRLHLHVKSLLRRVTDMAQQSGGRPTGENGVSPEGDASGGTETSVDSDVALGLQGRKRGDSSADRLERLLGAIATYSKSTGKPATSHTIEQTSPSTTESRVVKEEDHTIVGDPSKTARAMSSYTQRKRREYLLRKQASAEEGEDDDISNNQSVPSPRERVKSIQVEETETVPKATTTSAAAEVTSTGLSGSVSPLAQKKQLSSHSTRASDTPLSSPMPRVPRKIPTKKKRKQRTNKHKKRKPRPVSPDGLGADGIPAPGVYESPTPYGSHVPYGQAESMSQQSLRALLASLLALDDKLSREMVSQENHTR